GARSSYPRLPRSLGRRSVCPGLPNSIRIPPVAGPGVEEAQGEADDVGEVGDAGAGRVVAGRLPLEAEPEQQHDPGREPQRQEEEEREDAGDPGPGEEEEEGAEYAGDRSGGADQG